MTTECTLIISGNKTSITTYLNPPIYLEENDEYEAALVRLETYNSIPNITEKNNVFLYSNDDGNNWKNVTLPPDAYNINQIFEEIKNQMVMQGDYDNVNKAYYIDFKISRLSSVIDIKHKNFKVKFNCENSIGPTLGFNDETLSKGMHKSSNIVQINSVNTLLVNVDFITGSYFNNLLSNSIYNFYPIVPPGYKIVEKPSTLIYYRINKKVIDSVKLWLTDQNGNNINLQGEIITIKIQIRKRNRH